MNMKNKYVIHPCLSEKKFRELIRYLSVDLNATQIANLTRLSRQTINIYFNRYST